jgi:hypothetical protein
MLVHRRAIFPSCRGYNSLLRAVDMTGNSRSVRALPIDEARAILKKYGR